MSGKTIKSRTSEGFTRLLLFPVFLVLISGGCEYILPNKPPYLEKIVPADSAVYTAGQVVNFKVNAYDVDGSVKHVVFTPPNSPAYTDDSAPYEFAWQTSGLTAGYYHVEIKAVDNQDEPYIISATIRILGSLNSFAGFWATTVNTSGKAICSALDKDKIQIGRDFYDKGYGFQ